MSRSPGPWSPEKLEESLKYHFADPALLRRALVHRSAAHERGSRTHNESLEFMGDAVLSLGVSRMIHARLGEVEVGELARARAYLVSETNLARKARTIHLGEYLDLGRGEDKGGGREKESLLADTYEAVLGAIMQDGGIEAALAVVTRHFTAQVARLRPGARTGRDYKTRLQEALQAQGVPAPRYRLLSESGPDHRKLFTVELLVETRVVAQGSGSSKKSAEQRAASRAMASLDQILKETLPAR
jgi:ribonuclease-3